MRTSRFLLPPALVIAAALLTGAATPPQKVYTAMEYRMLIDTAKTSVTTDSTYLYDPQAEFYAVGGWGSVDLQCEANAFNYGGKAYYLRVGVQMPGTETGANDGAYPILWSQNGQSRADCAKTIQNLVDQSRSKTKIVLRYKVPVSDQHVHGDIVVSFE